MTTYLILGELYVIAMLTIMPQHIFEALTRDVTPRQTYKVFAVSVVIWPILLFLFALVFVDIALRKSRR